MTNGESSPADQPAASETPATPKPLEPAVKPGAILKVTDPAELAKYSRKAPHRTFVPSLGHLYGGNFPGGEVILSPMTVSEEKILAQAQRERMEMVDMIVKRCIVACPVKYESLLISDMFYMLLVIRNISYGPEYVFNMDCGGCGVQYRTTVKIPEGLKLTCLGPDDDHEPWSVTLPVSGDVLSFRLLRIDDESGIRSWTKQQYSRSQQKGDPGYVYRLSKHITSINGQDPNPVNHLSYVENMLSADSIAFRKAIREHDFGATLKVAAKCPKCGTEEQEAQIPFDREFFRPSNLSL